MPLRSDVTLEATAAGSSSRADVEATTAARHSTTTVRFDAFILQATTEIVRKLPERRPDLVASAYSLSRESIEPLLDCCRQRRPLFIFDGRRGNGKKTKPRPTDGSDDDHRITVRKN